MKKGLVFSSGKVKFVFHTDQSRCVRVHIDHGEDNIQYENGIYIVEIGVTGRKTVNYLGARLAGLSETALLRFDGYETGRGKFGKYLKIIQKNDILRTATYFEEVCVGCVHTYTETENISDGPIRLETVSSFNIEVPVPGGDLRDLFFYYPANGSYTECQWKKWNIEQMGFSALNDLTDKKVFPVSNTGSWSTKSKLSMGILANEKKGRYFMWQIESNGSWHSEIATAWGAELALFLGGGNFYNNDWCKILQPGETFTTVRAAITIGESVEEVLANMTRERRAAAVYKRLEKPLVIYNEYMHASWNSPSIHTLKELAPSAAEAGADIYVIDCGWHDDVENPFNHVGRWLPSRQKYPNGLAEVAEILAEYNMKLGLWMEPEVVGCLGDAASLYSEKSFFRVWGKRVVSGNRYQLDFRSHEVCDYLTGRIGDLIEKYGVAYFKFDYNIEVGRGTEVDAASLGDGLLEHCRAYIGWMDSLIKKYPNVIFENCSSGGQRMDSLTLSRFAVQSTSDQISYERYAYIAANILSAVLPEQAAVWSYPCAFGRSPVSDDAVAMNMVNGCVGVMNLASKLYLLSREQMQIVKEGMECYRNIYTVKKDAVPVFPFGFSSEKDPRLCFGFEGGGKRILFVYEMSEPEKFDIPVPSVYKNCNVLFPKRRSPQLSFKAGQVTVKMPAKCTACILELS